MARAGCRSATRCAARGARARPSSCRGRPSRDAVPAHLPPGARPAGGARRLSAPPARLACRRRGVRKLSPERSIHSICREDRVLASHGLNHGDLGDSPPQEVMLDHAKVATRLLDATSSPHARGVRKLSPSDRNRSFAGDDRVLAPYAVDAAAALCRRRRLRESSPTCRETPHSKRCAITLSMMPYSFASSAVMK
jgi:hypothetical protein